MTAERRGRKTKGLNLVTGDMTAWLPGWVKEAAPWFLISAVSFSIFLFPQVLLANNLAISNIRILSQNTSSDTALIEFDISWSNSWRDSLNYDAAWVFFKFQNTGETTYNHVTLRTDGTNPSGFSTGSGTLVDIIVPTDRKGCFIQRRQVGSGAVSVTDVQVVWDYGAGGFSDSNVVAASSVLKVYGVEMIYIPQGGFHVGDGSSGTEGQFEFGSSSSLPPAINSETGISFTSAAGDAWFYNSAGNTGEWSSGQSFNVSSSFPKGYNAFYLMKYELSSGQYVAFLNSLTINQQQNRVGATLVSSTITNYFVMANVSSTSASTWNRSVITCPSTGNNTTSPLTFSATSTVGAGRDNRPVNYLSWMDIAAYADWAALRPMTEFEYEKAARGTIYPKVGEYAWGTTGTPVNCSVVSGTENGTETCFLPGGAINCCGNNTISNGDGAKGPIRCGVFATSSTTTRAASGSGYYGNMELTGNLNEWVVTVGNSIGIAFSGTHGDGVLSDNSGASTDGNATNLDWPGVANISGVITGTGAGLRGGDFDDATPPSISNRTNASLIDSTRGSSYGGRLARTA